MNREEKCRKINEVSPSFCLAKWLQVSIDLHNGTTHSCHHPKRHRIPTEGLLENPSQLHNTPHKKLQRKAMLEGERPAECSYCWRIEDGGRPFYSDRMIKSLDPWAFPQLEEIKTLPWDADVAPSYLEVMLDNKCQLKCGYCFDAVSSSIAAEVQLKGPFPDGPLPTEAQDRGEANSEFYTEAFFKWLPQIWSKLRVLRVTGGEIFLAGSWNRLMNFIEENPNPNLHWVVNSNLSHPIKTIELFSKRAQGFLGNKTIGSMEFYTSLDAWGSKGAYIRNGLNFNHWLQNVEFLSQAFPDRPIVIMFTFNILSYFGLSEFLTKIEEIKKKGIGIILDSAFLRDPTYLSAVIATDSMKSELSSLISSLLTKNDSVFSPHEFEKLKNMVASVQIQDQSPTNIRTSRAAFFRFICEYDRRRKTNFLEIFPNASEFMKACKLSAFERIVELSN